MSTFFEPPVSDLELIWVQNNSFCFSILEKLKKIQEIFRKFWGIFRKKSPDKTLQILENSGKILS